MKLNIATGAHRDALKWKNTETTWQELRGKLRVPVVTKYTFAEYSAMSKQDRDKVKDKGGYEYKYKFNNGEDPFNFDDYNIEIPDKD